MSIRRQVAALVPSERDKICTHKHVPWSGKVPCTGQRRCTMCGMAFDSQEELVEARLSASWAIAAGLEGERDRIDYP